MTETRWRIPLSDVIVDDELVESVLEVVRSGWWSMGPRVEEFEREFAAFCGAAHGIAVANGTAALHLALLAVGCGPGDEVVVPSLNFVAAANTIKHTGAEPVFCDIVGPQELNLDAARASSTGCWARTGRWCRACVGQAGDRDALAHPTLRRDRRRRARRVRARGCPLRLVEHGAAGRGVRARVRGFLRRRARDRGRQRHRSAPPRAARSRLWTRATKWWCRR